MCRGTRIGRGYDQPGSQSDGFLLSASCRSREACDEAGVFISFKFTGRGDAASTPRRTRRFANRSGLALISISIERQADSLCSKSTRRRSKRLRLICKRKRCRGGLFNQRRILLCRFIQLGNGVVDLLDAVPLLFRRRRNLLHDVAHFFDRLDYLHHRPARLINEPRPLNNARHCFIDKRLDFLCRASRALCKRTHFSRNHLEAVLGELGFNILSTLKLNGFENHTRINATWLRAYGSRFAAPTDCIGAGGWAKGFPIGAHRFEVPDTAALEAIRSTPALAIWGDADRTLAAEHFLPLFSELFPLAPIHRLTGVGHYCLEDAPQEIATLIAAFLKAH